MADPTNTQNPHNLDIVREILLGQHAASIDSRLNALEAAFNTRAQGQDRAFNESIERVNARFTQLDQDRLQSEQSIVSNLKKFEIDIQQHLTLQREQAERKQDYSARLIAEDQAARREENDAVRAELDITRDALLAMSEQFNQLATRLTVLRNRASAKT